MTATLSLVSRAWSVFEGDKAQFTLTLSEPPKFPERVMVTTAPGTATYGSDYFAPATTQIVFAPGQTSQSFSISTLPDNKTEGPETFQVIATPANKALETRSLAVAINDLPKEQPGFQITMAYDASVPANIKSLFAAAAARWSKVITGDLTAVKFVDRTGQTRLVDDLLIQVHAQTLADPKMIAGTRIDDIRKGNSGTPANGNFSQNGLPYAATTTINTSFVNAPGLGNAIAHDIGHALGFGTLWGQGVGTYGSKVTQIGTTDPRFLGANALREFNRLFGVNGTAVPLFEQSQYTPPSYDGNYGTHWRDGLFNNTAAAADAASQYYELMTAVYDAGATLPNGQPIPAYLSSMTVGAMADLGYKVNYAAADNYVAPTSSQALVVAAAITSVGPFAATKPVAAKSSSVTPVMQALQGKPSIVSPEPVRFDGTASRRNAAFVTESRTSRPAAVVTVLNPPVLAGLHRG